MRSTSSTEPPADDAEPQSNPAVAAAASTSVAELQGALNGLHRALALLLDAPAADPLWVDRIRAVKQRLADLTSRDPDTLLYLLLFGAARTVERYSSHHALVCSALVGLCAHRLGWPEVEQRTLMLAALSMNLSITRLQDELVDRDRTLTLDQRQTIDQHAARSATLLAELGVDDELWTDVVARHHSEPAADEFAPPPDTPDRLAALLHRVDVLCAKMSPRRARRGMPPMQAMRDAFNAPNGRPDEIGVALTQILGMHPPGGLVRLANGEVGVVVRRGERPSRPWVVSVAASNRQPLAQPVLRDTRDDAYVIRASMRPEEYRAVVDHDRLLSLAAALP